jgi:hypothetical protein
MSDTKHTSGPWRIFDVLSNHELITDRKTAHETESIALFSKNPSPANRRLIAAAPDHHTNALYLDSVMPDVDEDNLDDSCPIEITITAKAVRDIRAAITKATVDRRSA